MSGGGNARTLSTQVDGLIFDFFSTAIEKILQDRKGSIRPLTSDEVVYEKNIDYCKKCLEAWRGGTGGGGGGDRLTKPIVLDLYLFDPESGNYLLIERWSILFKPSGAEVRSGSADFRQQFALITRRVWTLIRSLYCFMRLLPAFNLLRHCRKTPILGFQVYDPSRYATYPSAFVGESESYRFNQVSAGKGNLLISVSYASSNFMMEQLRSIDSAISPVIPIVSNQTAAVDQNGPSSPAAAASAAIPIRSARSLSSDSEQGQRHSHSHRHSHSQSQWHTHQQRGDAFGGAPTAGDVSGGDSSNNSSGKHQPQLQLQNQHQHSNTQLRPHLSSRNRSTSSGSGGGGGININSVGALNAVASSPQPEANTSSSSTAAPHYQQQQQHRQRQHQLTSNNNHNDKQYQSSTSQAQYIHQQRQQQGAALSYGSYESHGSHGSRGSFDGRDRDSFQQQYQRYQLHKEQQQQERPVLPAYGNPQQEGKSIATRAGGHRRASESSADMGAGMKSAAGVGETADARTAGIGRREEGERMYGGEQGREGWRERGEREGKGGSERVQRRGSEDSQPARGDGRHRNSIDFGDVLQHQPKNPDFYGHHQHHMTDPVAAVAAVAAVATSLDAHREGRVLGSGGGAPGFQQLGPEPGAYIAQRRSVSTDSGVAGAGAGGGGGGGAKPFALFDTPELSLEKQFNDNIYSDKYTAQHCAPNASHQQDVRTPPFGVRRKSPYDSSDQGFVGVGAFGEKGGYLQRMMEEQEYYHHKQQFEEQQQQQLEPSRSKSISRSFEADSGMSAAGVSGYVVKRGGGGSGGEARDGIGSVPFEDDDRTDSGISFSHRESLQADGAAIGGIASGQKCGDGSARKVAGKGEGGGRGEKEYPFTPTASPPSLLPFTMFGASPPTSTPTAVSATRICSSTLPAHAMPAGAGAATKASGSYQTAYNNINQGGRSQQRPNKVSMLSTSPRNDSFDPSSCTPLSQKQHHQRHRTSPHTVVAVAGSLGSQGSQGSSATSSPPFSLKNPTSFAATPRHQMHYGGGSSSSVAGSYGSISDSTTTGASPPYAQFSTSLISTSPQITSTLIAQHAAAAAAATAPRITSAITNAPLPPPSPLVQASPSSADPRASGSGRASADAKGGGIQVRNGAPARSASSAVKSAETPFVQQQHHSVYKDNIFSNNRINNNVLTVVGRASGMDAAGTGQGRTWSMAGGFAALGGLGGLATAFGAVSWAAGGTGVGTVDGRVGSLEEKILRSHRFTGLGRGSDMVVYQPAYLQNQPPERSSLGGAERALADETVAAEFLTQAQTIASIQLALPRSPFHRLLAKSRGLSPQLRETLFVGAAGAAAGTRSGNRGTVSQSMRVVSSQEKERETGTVANGRASALTTALSGVVIDENSNNNNNNKSKDTASHRLDSVARRESRLEKDRFRRFQAEAAAAAAAAVSSYAVHPRGREAGGGGGGNREGAANGLPSVQKYGAFGRNFPIESLSFLLHLGGPAGVLMGTATYYSSSDSEGGEDADSGEEEGEAEDGDSSSDSSSIPSIRRIHSGRADARRGERGLDEDDEEDNDNNNENDDDDDDDDNDLFGYDDDMPFAWTEDVPQGSCSGGLGVSGSGGVGARASHVVSGRGKRGGRGSERTRDQAPSYHGSFSNKKDRKRPSRKRGSAPAIGGKYYRSHRQLHEVLYGSAGKLNIFAHSSAQQPWSKREDGVDGTERIGVSDSLPHKEDERRRPTGHGGQRQVDDEPVDRTDGGWPLENETSAAFALTLPPSYCEHVQSSLSGSGGRRGVEKGSEYRSPLTFVEMLEEVDSTLSIHKNR